VMLDVVNPHAIIHRGLDNGAISPLSKRQLHLDTSCDPFNNFVAKRTAINKSRQQERKQSFIPASDWSRPFTM
jgi:hypothetical protein